MRRLIFTLTATAIGTAAFASTWQTPYSQGLSEAKAGHWAEARAYFQQATEYRKFDTPKGDTKNGAPYSPNFLAAYAGLKFAQQIPGDGQRILLDNVANEFESLLVQGQASRETFFFLDEDYLLNGQTDKRAALGLRFATTAISWKVDDEGITPEDLSLFAESVGNVKAAKAETPKSIAKGESAEPVIAQPLDEARPSHHGRVVEHQTHTMQAIVAQHDAETKTAEIAKPIALSLPLKSSIVEPRLPKKAEVRTSKTSPPPAKVEKARTAKVKAKAKAKALDTAPKANDAKASIIEPRVRKASAKPQVSAPQANRTQSSISEARPAKAQKGKSPKAKVQDPTPGTALVQPVAVSLTSNSASLVSGTRAEPTVIHRVQQPLTDRDSSPSRGGAPKQEAGVIQAGAVQSAFTGVVPTAPDKYALIVGNSESKIEGGKLPFAADDAQLIRQTLITKAGYPDSNIEVAINATSQQLAATINALASRIPDKATVFVYFTGVGANVDGKDYLAGVDSQSDTDNTTMLSKDDLYAAFMSKGARIFAFFQANRPIVNGHYFGSEIPLVGSISQMEATLPGAMVYSISSNGKQVGLFTNAVVSTLDDIHSSRTPILDFGWQVFYKLRRGDTGLSGGSSNQSPSLPVLTNMASDARF